MCTISDRQNPDHTNQWTKSKFEKLPTARQVPMPIRSLKSEDWASKPERSKSKKAPAPTPTERERQLRDWAQQKLPRVPVSNVDRYLPIYSNIVNVNFDNADDIRKYRIVLGDIKGRQVTKKETKVALIENFLHFQRKPTATWWTSDYVSHIVSVGPLFKDLKDEIGSGWTMGHLLSPRPGDQPHLMESQIVFEGKFEKDQLKTWMRIQSPLGASQGTGPENLHVYTPDQDLRILNLVSWYNIHARKFAGGLHGKKFYPREWELGTALCRDKTHPQSTPAVIVHDGYFTSMRPGVNCVGLNVNVTTTAFYPAEIFSLWSKARWGYDGAPSLLAVQGLRVEFIFDTKKPPKKHVVRSLGGTSDTTKFELSKDSGKKISVHNHMESIYRKKFNKSIYVVNVGGIEPGKEVWYPADLLRISRWQAVKGQVDDVFKDSMLKIAEKSPQNLRSSIRGTAFPDLGINPNRADSNIGVSEQNSFYKKFGLALSNDLTAVQARCLTPPKIQFLKDTKVVKNSSWNLHRVQFRQPAPQSRLEIFRLGGWSKNSDKAVEEFRKQLLNALKAYGLHITPGGMPIVDHVAENGRSGLGNALDHAYNQVASQQSKIFLVILPDKDTARYSDVKWWGDCLRGVPTVCLTESALSKKETKRIDGKLVVQMVLERGKSTSIPQHDLMLLGNLSMKINFKLGGTNQIVETISLAGTTTRFGENAGTMIVGADVSHGGRGKHDTFPSMAGVVATTDLSSGQYLASARLQDSGTEYIADLKGMMCERVLQYNKSNKKLPDQILFYRDGVSEGQYGMVKKHELQQIREGCNRAGQQCGKAADWCPIITLLVVTKRHHVRFFRKEFPSNLGKNEKNLNSGLVVDTTVTDPSCGNFYLQSHDSPLGTAKNGHYVVICNEGKYTLDQLEDITNRICYTGSRATKALSICTPARYADLLCNRLSCYMRVQKKVPPATGTELKDYEAGKTSWRTHGNQARKNPWHENMDGRMFYL